MPELPDLEIFSDNLHKALSGRRLKKITLAAGAKHKNSQEEFEDKLCGQRLLKVRRFGKQLFFDFENSNVLSIHLMLHGELHLIEGALNLKSSVLQLSFDNINLILTDFQGTANAALNPIVKDAPDALAKEANIEYFQTRLKTRTVIKTVLLNQDIVQGIGNAYADEILWDAKISPYSISKKIPDEKIEDLVNSIIKVLQNAINHIRRTHRDIIRGEVRDFLNVHNHAKTKSPTGAIIESARIGGRNTYYTDEQELYK